MSILMTLAACIPYIALSISTISAIYTYKTYKANLEPNIWLGQASDGNLAIHNLGTRSVLVSRFYESTVWDGHIHGNEQYPYWIIEPNKSLDIRAARPMFGGATLVFLAFDFIYGSTGNKTHTHSSMILSTARSMQYILYQKGAYENDLKNRKKIIDKANELGIDYKLVMLAAPE